MTKIIIGILFILLGVFQNIQLSNKKTWLVWTNWLARGHRDIVGDAEHENGYRSQNKLIILMGIFFISDQIFGFGILPD